MFMTVRFFLGGLPVWVGGRIYGFASKTVVFVAVFDGKSKNGQT